MATKSKTDLPAQGQKGPPQNDGPSGLSPAEEARWWDEHRDYWDALETPQELTDPARIRRTKPVNLRLPVDLIDALKREAERRAIPYQTLIRMWLKERLDAEARSYQGRS